MSLQDEGWKLNRAHYYQEGWLSTANLRGVVGVTYTTSNCAAAPDGPEPPFRTNYNLRGHRSEVKPKTPGGVPRGQKTLHTIRKHFFGLFGATKKYINVNLAGVLMMSGRRGRLLALIIQFRVTAGNV